MAHAARRRLEADGAELVEFKRCDPDARDGTSLPNCVKTYLPGPDGRWRMVFEVLRDTATGRLVLSYLAFGVAHPEHPWQPSVYQVDHRIARCPAVRRSPTVSQAPARREVALPAQTACMTDARGPTIPPIRVLARGRLRP